MTNNLRRLTLTWFALIANLIFLGCMVMVLVNLIRSAHIIDDEESYRHSAIFNTLVLFYSMACSIQISILMPHFLFWRLKRNEEKITLAILEFQAENY